MNTGASSWLFKGALWMSRRNGQALAQAMLERLNGMRKQEPQKPDAECWGELVEARPGWQRVREGLYQFRTGERLELKGSSTSDWIEQMAAIEVKPLSQGMPASVQKEFVEEAVNAAVGWWNRKGFSGEIQSNG